jgi:hypothetical protein
MTRIFNCGWEGATIAVSDTAAGGSIGTDTAGGWSRFCYHGGGISQGTEFDMGENNAELYGGLRFKISNGRSGGGTAGILLFRDETFTQQCYLYLQGQFWTFQNGASVAVSSTTAMVDGLWYWLEWHLVISDTVGVFQLKVNGQLVLDLSAIDTKATSSTFVRWLQVVNSGVANYDAAFDDMVVNNVTNDGGPLVNRAWPNEVAVMALPLTADTAVTDWLGSGMISGVPAAYATEIAADSPKLFLRLNETVGSTATDSSGLGHNGTYGSGVSLNVAGIDGDGPGVALNANNDPNSKVDVPDHADLDPTAAVTVELWVKGFYSWATGDQAVLMQKDGQYSLRYDSGGGPLLYFSVWVGAVRQDLSWNPVANTSPNFYDLRNDEGYHHIVGTYDGTTQALYVDGILRASRAQTGAISTTANAFRIGYGTSGFQNNRAMFADDCAIYATALSATRIQTHHKAGKGKFGLVDDFGRGDVSVVGNQDLEYIGTSAAANKQLFAHQTVDAGFPLAQSLTLWVGARKAQPADGQIQTLVKRAGVEANGATTFLGLSNDVFRTTWSRDPTDTTDWTPAKVNALDVGVKSV